MTDERRTPVRLRHLTIDEGSIVDDGANPLARVVFFKRRPGDTMQIQKGAPVAEELTEEMLSSVSDDLRRVIAQQLAIKDVEITNLRQQIAQTQATHAAEIKALTPQPGGVPGAPGQPGQPPPGQPGAQTQPGQPGAELPGTRPGGNPQPQPGQPGAQEGAQDMNAKPRDLEGANGQPPGVDTTEATPDKPVDAGATDGKEAGMSAAHEGTETPIEETEEEKAKKAAIFKRLPDAVRVMVEKRDREIADLRKSLANEIEIRKRRQYEDEAAAKFANLPLPRVEIAKALRSADEASEACGATVRRAFEIAGAVAKEGVSVVAKRIGRDIPPAARSAEDAIEGKVVEIRKSRPNLSREQALAVAYMQNPDLYVAVRSAGSTD